MEFSSLYWSCGPETHSIMLMIVAGANYEVIWADVGLNGRVSDGGVFRRSKLGQRLEEGKFTPEPLPNITSPGPYVFIGDDAFALHANFMKQYPHKIIIYLQEYVTIVFQVLDEYQEMYLG